MRNKWYLLSMVLLVAALLALPGVARSSMWVGGEIGGNCTFDNDVHLDIGGHTQITADKVGVQPAVIGGITIGYDFVNAGFGGYAWPDWMKYFFVCTDFTYNNIQINSQMVTFEGVNSNVPGPFPSGLGTRLDGYLAAWFFGVGVHYGFFPDSEIPIGRVHPYFIVGPAIAFSGITVKGWGSQSSVDPALGIETGIRWILLPNVTVDTAMRYRHAYPTYSFNPGGTPIDVSLGVNMLSFLVRANYHF